MTDDDINEKLRLQVTVMHLSALMEQLEEDGDFRWRDAPETMALRQLRNEIAHGIRNVNAVSVTELSDTVRAALEFLQLIERSSLGTPAAHRIRQLSSAREIASVLLRADERAPRPARHAKKRPGLPSSEPGDVAEAPIRPAAAPDRSLGIDPETGYEIVAKDGRYGAYVTEVLPTGSREKPRIRSLFKTMELATVTLDDALQLLTLPRVVGIDIGTREEIIAQNGYFGPYLKRGTDARALETEEQLFTVTLLEALKIFDKPNRTRRTMAPLKELGTDPVSGRPMVVMDGRFGPYVTDGEDSVALRNTDSVEGMTTERGAELLADKRAKSERAKRKAPLPKPLRKAPTRRRRTGS